MHLPQETAKEHAVHQPNLDDMARLFQGPFGIRSIALTGLFILACFYTLYFARDFFLPVVLAIVFKFLFAPVVRVLRQYRIAEALSSAAMIVVLFAVLGFLCYEFSGPLTEWVEKLPQVGAQLQTRVQPLKAVFEKISKISEQAEELATMRGGPKRQTPQVELKQPGLLDVLFSNTSRVVFSLLVVIVLLYFLLASGDLFLAKLVHVLPTFSDKKKAVQIAREIETNISLYLLTITVINAGIGVLSGLIFWGFGMPNPALWGALAGILNFVPTIGALTVVVIITLDAATTFPSLTHALLVPAAFLGLTVAVGTFVSPLIMGRRLTLNPVVIFLGLSFWGWLWGIPGALLAVPMLSMFKIFCDHIEPLAPIGEFLGASSRTR